MLFVCASSSLAGKWSAFGLVVDVMGRSVPGAKGDAIASCLSCRAVVDTGGDVGRGGRKREREYLSTVKAKENKEEEGAIACESSPFPLKQKEN
jgi:hypothetical protein